jgi:hypothetical protein
MLATMVCIGAASGCSFSVGDTPQSVATELIEGELATELALGEITAECEEPPNRDTGTTFGCTSATDYGEVRWLATMADEDSVNVESLNVLSDANVTDLENTTNAQLGTSDADCGSGPIVLGVDLTVVCALTDPATGDVYDVTLTFTDLEAGTFDIVVADTPRS